MKIDDEVLVAHLVSSGAEEDAQIENSFDPKVAAEIEADLDLEPDYDAGPELPPLLTMFLHKVGGHRILTAEEEVKLAKRYERGDMEAKDEMIDCNYKLVIAIARKKMVQKMAQKFDLEMMDLIQSGMEGLIRAVEKFDWRKGWKFSTYATWWIKQKMDRNAEDGGANMRLPSHVWQRINKISRVSKALLPKLKKKGQPLTIALLAEETDIKEEHIREALEAHMRMRKNSFEAPVGEEGQFELGQLIADEEADVEEEVVEPLAYSRTLELVQDLLDKLDPDERLAITLLFGLDGQGEREPEKAAKEMGVSIEILELLEVGALEKMAHEGDHEEVATLMAA